MTNQEFKSLPRYPNGRIVNFSEVFYKLTPKQIEKLHGDDWSYYGDLQEEVNYEFHLMMEAR